MNSSSVITSIPSSLAFLFIKSQKAGILPEVYSAKATAASFPEHKSNPYNKSVTVILSFNFRPKREPPVEAAFFDIITVSFKLQCS